MFQSTEGLHRREKRCQAIQHHQRTRKYQSGGDLCTDQVEISLLKNVDEACEEFGKEEEYLDLLLMCPGYLKLTRGGTLDFYRPNNLKVYGRAEKAKE